MCEYDVPDGRKTRERKGRSNSPRQPRTAITTPTDTNPERSLASNQALGPGAVFENEDNYVGAASGLSFLQQAVEHMETQEASTGIANNAANTGYLSPTSASIFDSGDMPPLLLPSDKFLMPSKSESDGMLALYFDFATPTYRFFHRPSVEDWASQLYETLGKPTTQGTKSKLDGVKAAAVYLIWAQAIEYEDARTRGSKTR